MTSAAEAAHKIMALVDEFPSEPFSFERKGIMEQIETIIARHTQEYEEELDNAFGLGVDEGIRQSDEEWKVKLDEYETEIEILRTEKDEAYQKGYDDGFDTAAAAGN